MWIFVLLPFITSLQIKTRTLWVHFKNSSKMIYFQFVAVEVVLAAFRFCLSTTVAHNNKTLNFFLPIQIVSGCPMQKTMIQASALLSFNCFDQRPCLSSLPGLCQFFARSTWWFYALLYHDYCLTIKMFLENTIFLQVVAATILQLDPNMPQYMYNPQKDINIFKRRRADAPLFSVPFMFVATLSHYSFL